MNHKVTYLKREEKVSKRTNKPFTSLSLKLDTYGERYLKGFADARNAHWQVGTELTDTDILVTETEPNEQGKTYLNFKTPKKEDMIEGDVRALTARVQMLEERVDKMAAYFKKNVKNV